MALYDDASFIFLASGAAGVENKDFSKVPCVKPVEVTGSELLSSSDGDWTLGTGASISNGVITVDGSQSSSINLFQNITDLDNKSAKISFTISNHSAGTIQGQFFGGNEVTPSVGQNGTFAFTKDIGGSHNGNAGFGVSSDFEGTISNISIKEVTAKAADFDISRDDNLDATRVGPDGLIEKGRENLFRNTVFAGAGLDTEPTGGSKFIDSTGGTFNTTSTAGQLRFITASDERAFIQSHSITTASLYSFSVFVDEVVTTLPVNRVISDSGEATDIRYEEDGVEISTSTNVQAGKRYTMVVNKTNTNSTRFRIGSGTSSQTAGDVTLSKPQLEVGIVATDYIENTSTSGSAIAGIKEDEPRFDYPLAGGAPSLLLEPERTNLIKVSEYFGGSTWTDQSSGVTVVNNHAVSPEGVKNAAKLVIDNGVSAGAQFRTSSIPVTSGKLYAFSIFAKADGFDQVQLDVFDSKFGSTNTDATFSGDGSITSSGAATTASSIENYGNGWYRIILIGTCIASGTSDFILRLQVNAINGTGDGSKGILIYGAQVEEGPYASSYIPTHGATATRSGEGEAEDTFKATLPTALNGASAYTLFMDLTVTDLEEETDFRDVLIFRDSSGSKEAFKLETFFNNGTSSLRGFAYKTSQVSGATASIAHDTIAIGSRCKLAVVFNSASGIKAFYNGSGTPVINYSEATTYESVDVIQGAEATVTGTRSRTRLHGIHGYPSALSDAQCISLTTL